jgi:hypothetical protein
MISVTLASGDVFELMELAVTVKLATSVSFKALGADNKIIIESSVSRCRLEAEIQATSDSVL